MHADIDKGLINIVISGTSNMKIYLHFSKDKKSIIYMEDLFDILHVTWLWFALRAWRYLLAEEDNLQSLWNRLFNSCFQPNSSYYLSGTPPLTPSQPWQKMHHPPRMTVNPNRSEDFYWIRVSSYILKNLRTTQMRNFNFSVYGA